MFFVPVSRRAIPDTRYLSRMLDPSLDRFFSQATSSTEAASRAPALDVTETDAAYTVQLDMPGVNKDDIKVSVEGRQVTVQAGTQVNEQKKDGERVVYRERALARYARTLTLPVEVEQAETIAKLEHGVLTLTLPKRSARSAAQIAIN